MNNDNSELRTIIDESLKILNEASERYKDAICVVDFSIEDIKML